MEQVLEAHARRILAAAAGLPAAKKYLVLIAGAPGSGKTTSAAATCRLLNQLAGADAPVAVVASMDGFHYYRRELDAMPDPLEAHARRGAHWTFDAPAFVAAVQALTQQREALWPSFDHAVGDPVPADVRIQPQHGIVLVEGNYVLLEEEPWRQLRALADEAWFIDCDLAVAMERVVARQVGNGSDRATAERRVATNDRPNAELIARTKHRACTVIPSLPYSSEAGA